MARPALDLAAPLLTVEEMTAWDRRAIDALGVAEPTLMESAGRVSADLIALLAPPGPVCVVVGPGNNGGDGLIAARTLRARGREVWCVAASEKKPPSELLHGWPMELERERVGERITRAAVVVDAILGTGVRDAPRPAQAEVIEQINRAPGFVVALDGPSGVDLATGRVAGAAVRADLTIAFGAPKVGHVRFPGRAQCGRTLAVEVGFPPLAPEEFGALLVDDRWAFARLPSVPPDAHKGSMGRILVVAGRRGMGGAAVMVTMAALRGGAGLVVVAGPEENRLVVQSSVPEALFVDRSSDAVQDEIDDADVVVAGPGMGTGRDAAELLERILATEAQLLLDADALTLLAEHRTNGAGLGERALLTPHPGEMSRLLGTGIGEVLDDPFAAAADAADRFGCAVLLKGSPSVVAAPGHPLLVSVAGGSGLATGGTGDTLAGIAGAMMGRGADPGTAGALALTLGGRAAERAARGAGLLPRDIAETLPAAMAGLHLSPVPVHPAVTAEIPPPN